jgi:inositol hexakisphosphate/diphosphoinositol-pentakisphosphate kinase
VLAVIRHGDRTPKQKIKVNVTDEPLLNLLMKHGNHQPGKLKQAKLKSPNQLQELLDAVRPFVRFLTVERRKMLCTS